MARNWVKRKVSQSRAMKTWRARNPKLTTIGNYASDWRKAGKHTIFKPSDILPKLEEQGCHFCGKPWTDVDVRKKLKRDILEEDVIPTCKTCHRVYLAFHGETEMMEYLELLYKAWNGIQ